MSEWKVENIATLANGKKAKDISPAALYPIYGGNGIMGYTNSYNASNVVIIGRVGAYCGSVHYSREKCWISDNAISAKAKNDNNIDYLYYLLSSLNLNRHHMGGAQPLMTQGIINNIDIPKHSLSEQKKIAAILSSINEKIETNRKINALLEELSQALFQSWFIDFEPFGGKMPADWETCTLGDLTVECKNRVRNREDVKVLSPISSGELVRSDEYFSKQVYSKELSKYIIVAPNAFAYNPARVNIGSIGKNNFKFDGCVSPVYVVFRAIDGYEEFINQFIKTKLFKDEVLLRAIGGVRQTLNYHDFSLIEFNKPNIDVVTHYTDIVNPLYIKMGALNTESARLAALRDTLLPKLMSGEIKPE